MSLAVTRGMVAMYGSLPAMWAQMHPYLDGRSGASFRPLLAKTLSRKPLS